MSNVTPFSLNENFNEYVFSRAIDSYNQRAFREGRQLISDFVGHGIHDRFLSALERSGMSMTDSIFDSNLGTTNREKLIDALRESITDTMSPGGVSDVAISRSEYYFLIDEVLNDYELLLNADYEDALANPLENIMMLPFSRFDSHFGRREAFVESGRTLYGVMRPRELSEVNFGTNLTRAQRAVVNGVITSDSLLVPDPDNPGSYIYNDDLYYTAEAGDESSSCRVKLFAPRTDNDDVSSFIGNGTNTGIELSTFVYDINTVADESGVTRLRKYMLPVDYRSAKATMERYFCNMASNTLSSGDSVFANLQGDSSSGLSLREMDRVFGEYTDAFDRDASSVPSSSFRVPHSVFMSDALLDSSEAVIKYLSDNGYHYSVDRGRTDAQLVLSLSSDRVGQNSEVRLIDCLDPSFVGRYYSRGNTANFNDNSIVAPYIRPEDRLTLLKYALGERGEISGFRLNDSYLGASTLSQTMIGKSPSSIRVSRNEATGELQHSFSVMLEIRNPDGTRKEDLKDADGRALRWFFINFVSNRVHNSDVDLTQQAGAASYISNAISGARSSFEDRMNLDGLLDSVDRIRESWDLMGTNRLSELSDQIDYVQESLDRLNRNSPRRTRLESRLQSLQNSYSDLSRSGGHKRGDLDDLSVFGSDLGFSYDPDPDIAYLQRDFLWVMLNDNMDFGRMTDSNLQQVMTDDNSDGVDDDVVDNEVEDTEVDDVADGSPNVDRDDISLGVDSSDRLYDGDTKRDRAINCLHDMTDRIFGQMDFTYDGDSVVDYSGQFNPAYVLKFYNDGLPMSYKDSYLTDAMRTLRFDGSELVGDSIRVKHLKDSLIYPEDVVPAGSEASDVLVPRVSMNDDNRMVVDLVVDGTDRVVHSYTGANEGDVPHVRMRDIPSGYVLALGEFEEKTGDDGHPNLLSPFMTHVYNSIKNTICDTGCTINDGASKQDILIDSNGLVQYSAKQSVNSDGPQYAGWAHRIPRAGNRSDRSLPYCRVEGTIGQIFEPDENGLLETNYHGSDNRLYVYGYDLRVVGRDIDHATDSVVDRMRAVGLAEQVGLVISNALRRDLVSAGDFDMDNGIKRLNSPVAANYAYRHTQKSIIDVRVAAREGESLVDAYDRGLREMNGLSECEYVSDEVREMFEAKSRNPLRQAYRDRVLEEDRQFYEENYKDAANAIIKTYSKACHVDSNLLSSDAFSSAVLRVLPSQVRDDRSAECGAIHKLTRDCNAYDAFVAVDGRNMATIAGLKEYNVIDPYMTSTKTGHTVYLVDGAFVDPSTQKIVPSSVPNDVAPSRYRDEHAFDDRSPADRVLMSLSNGQECLRVMRNVKVGYFTINGLTFDDGSPMSSDFAKRAAILNKEGKRRPLLSGDKPCPVDGNKGINSYVVDVDWDEAEAAEKGKLLDWQVFAMNPELSMVKPPYALISRDNASAFCQGLTLGTEPILLPGTADVPDDILLTGEERQKAIDKAVSIGAVLPEDVDSVKVVPGVVQEGYCFITRHIGDEHNKHYWNDENEEGKQLVGKGRRISAQYNWILPAIDAYEILSFFYKNNERAMRSLRECLFTLGLPMAADTKMSFDFFKPMANARNKFGFPDSEEEISSYLKQKEYRNNRGNSGAGSLVVDQAKVNDSFARLVSSRGGILKFPFPLKLASGNYTPALDDVDENGNLLDCWTDKDGQKHPYYAVPVLSASERSQEHTFDDSAIGSEIMQKYLNLYKNGLEYLATAKGLMNRPVKDIENAAQGAFSAVSQEIFDKKICCKHNIFREEILAVPTSKSATLVVVPDASLDIDQCAVNSATARKLGLHEGDPLFVHRDPILRENGIRLGTVHIDDSVNGMAINPLSAVSFDADFDGDSFAVVVLSLPDANVDAKYLASFTMKMLDNEKIYSDEDSRLEKYVDAGILPPRSGEKSLFCNFTMDYKSAESLDWNRYQRAVDEGDAGVKIAVAMERRIIEHRVNLIDKANTFSDLKDLIFDKYSYPELAALYDSRFGDDRDAFLSKFNEIYPDDGSEYSSLARKVLESCDLKESHSKNKALGLDFVDDHLSMDDKYNLFRPELVSLSDHIRNTVGCACGTEILQCDSPQNMYKSMARIVEHGAKGSMKNVELFFKYAGYEIMKDDHGDVMFDDAGNVRFKADGQESTIDHVIVPKASLVSNATVQEVQSASATKSQGTGMGGDRSIKGVTAVRNISFAESLKNTRNALFDYSGFLFDKLSTMYAERKSAEIEGVEGLSSDAEFKKELSDFFNEAGLHVPFGVVERVNAYAQKFNDVISKNPDKAFESYVSLRKECLYGNESASTSNDSDKSEKLWETRSCREMVDTYVNPMNLRSVAVDPHLPEVKRITVLNCVLQMTYLMTQGLLQAKHDAEKAVVLMKAVSGAGRELWRGHKIAPTLVKDRNGNSVNEWAVVKNESGYPVSCTKEEWVDCIMKFYCDDGPNACGLKMGNVLNPEHVQMVADMLFEYGAVRTKRPDISPSADILTMPDIESSDYLNDYASVVDFCAYNWRNSFEKLCDLARRGKPLITPSDYGFMVMPDSVKEAIMVSNDFSCSDVDYVNPGWSRVGFAKKKVARLVDNMLGDSHDDISNGKHVSKGDKVDLVNDGKADGFESLTPVDSGVGSTVRFHGNDYSLVDRADQGAVVRRVDSSSDKEYNGNSLSGHRDGFSNEMESWDLNIPGIDDPSIAD